MSAHPLIIQKALELYIKHRGRNLREIEREMRALGHTTFTRRVLHGRTYKNGKRLPGWIEKYNWKDELYAQSEPGAVATGAVAAALPPTANCKPPLTAHGAQPTFKDWLTTISPQMKWHWGYQQLIYDKLQQVTDGTCKRLMIFLPPRHGKSELVTVRYSAWRLQQDPSLNIILGSYNQRLANRFSRKVRIALEDAQFRQEEETRVSEPGAVATGAVKSMNGDSPQRSQEAEPTAPASSDRQPPPANCQPTFSRRRLNTVAEWETGLGGGLRAVGVGGGITGFGADLVIIDDPVRSRAEAESKTYRDKTYEWFCDDLYTRLEPNASIILIQTRWHEDDLAGRLLRDAEEPGSEQWDVISLPALAEEGMSYSSTRDISTPVHPEHANSTSRSREGGPAPASSSKTVTPKGVTHTLCKKERAESCDILGRQPGEPLCPERFSKDDLLRIKRKLGTYSFSALYQQRPTPPEGGLFKRKWFSRIIDRAPDNLKWVRAYDLAVSTNTSADYTASFRCALDKQTGELYIADGFRGRIEFPEQRKFIVDRILGEPDTEHGIEQALHGQAFVQDLRREYRLFGKAFRGVKVTTDKFTRALSWANLAEEGKVVLVRGGWIEDFLAEVTTFPNSAHDDQVDAISLAVQMLEKRKHLAIGF